MVAKGCVRPHDIFIWNRQNWMKAVWCITKGEDDMNSICEIDIQKEYQKRIGVAYADCSYEQCRNIIGSLATSKFENDFVEKMTSYFLVHIFMLGLQEMSISLTVPKNMNYESKGIPAYVDVSLEEIMSVYTWTENSVEKKITISLKQDTVIWKKYDSMVVAACCCREIFQWIAASPQYQWLANTGSGWTRRPKIGVGYYSLSFEEDEVCYEKNEKDIEIYLDSMAVFATGFEINPINAAEKKRVIIGAGAGASRMLAKALLKLDEDAWRNFCIYLIDPVSQFRDWQDMYDVPELKKNHACPVTSVVTLSRLTKGLNCQTKEDAYRLAASCKRYLQEIFSMIEKNESVIITYCTNEYFGNAFALQCADYIHSKGLQELLIPIQVIPSGSMHEQKRMMSDETYEKLVALSSNFDKVDIWIEDDAEERFRNAVRNVMTENEIINDELMKRYTPLIYKDSEKVWVERMIKLLHS